MIEKVVTMYIEEITKYVEVPEKVEVYIMEKEAPLPIEKKNLVKDGIHIVITNIVTRPSVQYVVRTNLLEPFGKVLEEMPITNTIEDVFDEQVIEKNNWQMYGSKKPATEAYRVTHHWSVSEQVITENDILEEDSDYVEILSIRNKFIENTVKQELKSEVNKIDKILKQAEYKKEMLEAIRVNLGDSSAGVRSKAIRSYGKLARHGHLDKEERQNCKETCELLLGADDQYDWDRAYIVRKEAQEALDCLEGGED
jgi:hypothetical protein